MSISKRYKENVYSVAVYQKYRTRLGELSFQPDLKQHSPQQSLFSPVELKRSIVIIEQWAWRLVAKNGQ